MFKFGKSWLIFKNLRTSFEQRFAAVTENSAGSRPGSTPLSPGKTTDVAAASVVRSTRVGRWSSAAKRVRSAQFDEAPEPAEPISAVPVRPRGSQTASSRYSGKSMPVAELPGAYS